MSEASKARKHQQLLKEMEQFESEEYRYKTLRLSRNYELINFLCKLGIIIISSVSGVINISQSLIEFFQTI
jgi:hypothetical protein